MKDNIFFKNIQNFLEEFQALLNTNEYISQSKYDDLIKKYPDVYKIGNIIDDELIKSTIDNVLNNAYKIIKEHNNNYLETELKNNEDYFNNLFNDIDPNIKLDLEQKKAILCDEDYSLIIAGAGSGKTTTMAAKVKYLIEKKRIDPKRIILLSLTNKAVLELDTRINEDFKLNVEVLTFHKLGMKFLRNNFPNKLSIASDKTLYDIISDYIKLKVFKNKELLKEFTSLFKDYCYFDDKAFDYSNFDDYYKYYSDKLYEQNKNNLDKFNKKRIKNREKIFKTIKGEYVKSVAEVNIANYLYLHGINYEYEKIYDYSLDNNHTYAPDFTIYYQDNIYYLEYYGLTKYLKNGKYTTYDIETYNKLIIKKRLLHEKYKTDLIELYFEYENSNYLLELIRELKKREIVGIEKTEKEVFYQLMNTAKESQFFKFINLTMTFINLYKEKNYKDDYFLELSKNQNEITIKRLNFLKNIYNFYNLKIHSEYKIDFNDMINYAYYSVFKSREEYDYIIIDEYQDISRQKYNLAKKISSVFKAKIIAVGDDWQSIFSFSGSDIDLFTNFCDLMGYGEIIKIKNTYRNSQELIDIASQFVSKNDSQIIKNLKSSKHLDNPIEIHYYDDLNSKILVIINLIESIYQKNKNSKILLLGRYKSDIEELLLSGMFKTSVKDQIICLKSPKVYLDFLTVHASKGLGYDEVILLNALDDEKGFPSKIKDDDLIKLLRPVEKTKIDFPEERRLFYVAITRTKNKVYILCPKNYQKRSEFIKEIVGFKNTIEVYH